MIELIPDAGISQQSLDAMYNYRLERIRAVMAEHNISLSILTSPVNLRYAINFDEYLMFQSHIPTAHLFIPLEGPVTLFGASQRHHANVDSYQGSRFATPFDGGLDLSRQSQRIVEDIERFIRDHQLHNAGSRIALERFSPLISQQLVSKGYWLTDGEALIEQAKLIKHPTELDRIRHSIAVAEYGIHKMHTALQPGITENQLWSVIHQVILPTAVTGSKVRCSHPVSAPIHGCRKQPQRSSGLARWWLLIPT